MSRPAPNPTDQTRHADLRLTNPLPSTGRAPHDMAEAASAGRSHETGDPSRQRRFSWGAAVLLGLGLAGPLPAIGETVILVSESDFLDRLAEPFYVERFDGYVLGSPFNGSQISADFGPVDGYSWTVSTNQPPGSFDGLYSGPGNLSVNDANDSLFITFTGDPVTAVGGLFRAEDEDANVLTGQQVIVRLADGTEESITGSGFRGFVSSEPITGMRIRAPNVVVGDVTQTFVWPSMDNFYVGSVGPSIRWIKEGNGAWGDESNWDPERVPEESDITLFELSVPVDVDLAAEKYTVLGSRFTGSGATALRRGELEIAGALSISRSADVQLDDVLANVGTVIVGDRLSSVGTPRLGLERETELNAGNVVIGRLGRDARLDIEVGSGLFAGGDLTVGELERGSADVKGISSALAVTGQTFIGRQSDGSVSIDRQASFVTTGPAFVGGVDSGDYRSGFSAEITLKGLGTWDALGPVGVGGNIRGLLRIDEGEASLFDGLTVGSVAHPGSDRPGGTVFVGPIVQPGGERRSSRLTVGQLPGLTVGQNGGYGLLFAGFGGEVFVEKGELSVPGTGAGSRGSVGVQGVGVENGTPVRATLQVEDLDPNSDLYECYVGSVGGRGEVQVLEGGHWICPKVSVGGAGQGRVVISGRSQGFDSELEAREIDIGSSGVLAVQAQGEVRTNNLVIRSGGTVQGDGTIFTFFSDIQGTVVPGVDVFETDLPLEPIQPLSGPGIFRTMDFTPATISTLENGPSPSTLTLVGNVVLASSAVIELDVWGPGLADRLEVDGTLQINGATLVLNFLDGYLPSEGDLLDLIAATGGVNGSFGNVVFNGLGPGFEYRIDIVNGAVSLTALNDATEDDGSGGDGPGLNPPPVAIPTLSQLGLLLLALMLLLAGFRARGRSPRG
jgi:hypothetical protein